jgi:tRNA (guanine9-N1)-methyltransferase
METKEDKIEPVESSTAETTIASETTTATSEVKMSKNQLKKQRRLERLLALKAEKRKREREIRKEKRKNNKAVKVDNEGNVIEIHRKSLKNNLMENSANRLRVVIDCSFENLMNISDISHLGKQVAYCYAINRRMTAPLQLYLTSCTGKMKELLDKSGLSNWDVHRSEKSFLDLFLAEQSTPKDKIVYLTSDSPNELNEFDDDKVYIIGGLVDHNHHKSLCYNLALENGIAHCQLPIGKYLNMKTRSVLTVNQVYQIICKYVECKDWKQAFMSTLPKRKGAEVLSDESESSSSGSNSERMSDKNQELSKYIFIELYLHSY